MPLTTTPLVRPFEAAPTAPTVDEQALLLAHPSLADSITSVSRGVVAWCTPSLRPDARDYLELSVSTAAMRTADGERLGEPSSQDGAFGRAARLAALAYGADHCLLGVHGSSGQNHVVARVLAQAENPHVLLPVNAHHSLVDALVDLCVPFSRIGAGYLPDLEAILPPTVEQVRAAIDSAATPVTGVVISSPTYEGLAAEIPAIAELVHGTGAVLAVDAAWGAHTPFLPGGGPIAPGADLVVTSTHKTAGARQQTSLLLHRDGRVAWEDVQRAHGMTATTSPSFPLLADIDATVRWLLRDGERALSSTVAHVQRLADAVRREHSDLEILGGTSDVDPLRVTIGALDRLSTTGHALAADLANRGIVVEKRGIKAATFLAPLQLDDDAVSFTISQLRELLPPARGDRKNTTPQVVYDAFSGTACIAAADPTTVKRAIADGRTEAIPVTAAVGRVAAHRVELYPPGIPLILPGFEITAETAQDIREGADLGASVASTAGTWTGLVHVLLPLPDPTNDGEPTMHEAPAIARTAGPEDPVASRRRKLLALREAGIEPYPHDFPGVQPTAVVHDACERAPVGESDPHADPVRIAGRLLARRDSGGLSFLDIEDRSGTLQVLAEEGRLGRRAYDELDLLDLGDIVGVDGRPARSRRGAPSVAATTVTLLAKAHLPPPGRRAGLRDPEARRRHRELDLMANAEVRARFAARATVVRELRGFLDGRGFLEVETPILQPLYGGANARPFTTHHNALDRTLYLRIAPELYLKRCIVGGLERVYEIGKDFRNEGVSSRHNPEFTMVEWYEAYADYLDLAGQLEQLVARIARSVGAPAELGLEQPWARETVCGAIESRTGIDVRAFPDPETLAAEITMRDLECEPGATWAQLVDGLVGDYVEPTLTEPTFLMDHPVELSPLAKGHRNDPGLVERFEAYIGRMEIANAFTELNDPEEQRSRFEAEARNASTGDEEAQPLDEEFLQALAHGMPPTAGIGVGIDRLVMVLTGAASIRDVVLFPAMR